MSDPRTPSEPDNLVCQCWNEGQWGRVHTEECPIHQTESDLETATRAYRLILAAAVEHGTSIPEPKDPIRERALEARGEISTAIGFLRVHMRDEGIPEVEGEWVSGEDVHTSVLRRMWTALDRLDRVVSGEDYIEKWEALRAEHPGVISPLGIPECCLPEDHE